MREEVPSFPWFALHVRIYDHEHVETALRHKGLDVFAPTYAATRIMGGHQRRIQKPLFPGYLFCAFDPQHRLPVLTVHGVIDILGMGSHPTPVPVHEIEAIRRAIESGLPFEPFRLLQPGELVEVQSGPLKGVQGVVVNYKGKYRLIMTVTALNDRAVSVEVDSETVTRCTPSVFPRPAPRIPIQKDSALIRQPYVSNDLRVDRRCS